MERAIHDLAMELEVSPRASQHAAQAQLDRALRDMREALHSRGRLSSRNEALDELAKLLFAHSVAVRNGLQGVGSHLLADPQFTAHPAVGLVQFVAEMVERFLPESLGHEFSPDDFVLRLKSSENALATDLIRAFDSFNDTSQQATAWSQGSADLINDAFGQFIADSFADEKELGQYLTPSEVVRFMVDLAIDEMDAEDLAHLANPRSFQDFGFVLDPSCGVGSFLAEFIRTLHARLHPDAVPADWSEKAARDLVVGFDKSERMVRLALANLATFGAPAARLHLMNSLAKTGVDGDVARDMEGKVGLILTNPPFGARFKGSDVSDYRIAQEWSPSTPASVDSELLFLERYIDWLKPGGHLLAIVPDSILTNRGLFARLRQGLAPEIELRTVISLPSVTFAAAGTSTKTSILHLRKGKQKEAPVRFAVCEDIGYTVATRGSQRRKLHSSSGDLPKIRKSLQTGEGESVYVVEEVDEAQRWDAGFHASSSAAVLKKLGNSSQLLRVEDVAELSTERMNPQRLPGETFQYIEISDVKSESIYASAKEAGTASPAGRARMVARAGDVLVSTVRPERSAIGVVPPWLDESICTTGFGVLRPFGINPVVLSMILKTDFVKQQLLRNNVGIAYPAIDAECLLEVVLPVSREDLSELTQAADALAVALEQTRSFEEIARRTIAKSTDQWLSQNA